MQKLLTTALFFALSAAAAASTFRTGNDLLLSCKAADTFNQGVCNGYMTGVFDVENAFTEAGVSKRIFCIPAGATAGQLQLVVIQYLEEHPEELHLTAAGLTLLAFQDAFPCN